MSALFSSNKPPVLPVAWAFRCRIRSLGRYGAKPMLHGFIISTLVVLVAIGVEYMIGIAPYGTL